MLPINTNPLFKAKVIEGAADIKPLEGVSRCGFIYHGFIEIGLSHLGDFIWDSHLGSDLGRGNEVSIESLHQGSTRCKET